MYDILKTKFSDDDLKARLVFIGDKKLIEGKNMLGKLLMKLRDELKK